MAPPQTQGAPAVPKMGVRVRVSNWSKKQDIGDVQPPPRVDSLGSSVSDGPSKDLLETSFQDSRRTLVTMKRSNSELTISDFGSEDADPAAVCPNSRVSLTRGYGSSSSLDLLGSSGFMEVLRVDQEPSGPVPQPPNLPVVLSPSLQAAVQIASGDMVLVPGGVETSVTRRKPETSVLSRLRPQRTGRNQDASALSPHRSFSHYDVQSVLFTVAESQAGRLWSPEAPDLLPSVGHEELLADGRRSSLVLVCPQFLSEVGGETERNQDLTRFGKAAGTSCTNAAVSILEASSETQLCSANVLGTNDVEYWDLGAKYYQKYFYNKDHQNYFGTDPNFGPVSLSIRREALDDGRNPTQFNYRIILRTGRLSALRGSVMEDSVPSSSKHGTSRGLPLKDVLEFLLPELNLQSLRAASGSPRVPDLLLQLDQQELVLQHRVDLFLSRAGQNPGRLLYDSNASSPALTQFLDLLTHRDPMKNFYQDQHNSSGTRTTSDPGTQSVCTAFREFQLTFQVSVLPPAGDATQVLRTRLAGNDDITVIFQEPEAPPFRPQNVRSDFPCVFVVVRVHQPCTQHTCYSLAVSRSRDVPPFGPTVPPARTFPASSGFVDFLLTKIVNAKLASRRSAPSVAMATRRRQEQLKQLAETFAKAAAPSDFSSSARFSFISLAGKKKERVAPRPLAYLQSAGALTWSVTLRDPSSSAAVACRLAVSGHLVALVEEAGRKVVFSCCCSDVIGWSAAHGSVTLFYGHGLSVAFSTRGGRWEDSQEITHRLQTVTQGGAAAAVTLRRNRLGQLGFHVNLEGVVADVEAHGFAWQAGLRPGCRLVEICSVPVATLSHEEMIELLRTSVNVTAVVLPPHRDGTPRRSFSETHRLPLLEIKLDSDVTSCSCAMPAAPPTATAPSNQSPVQRIFSSDMKEGSGAAPDWLISSDESAASMQDWSSSDKAETHPPPPPLPHHVTRALSPADRKQQKFTTKSCSSCSNTLSSNSSDGRNSTPQLVCHRGASVDSGIDAAHYTWWAPPQVAGATLVLTDVVREETQSSGGHVTDLRGAGHVARGSCGSRRSSADRMKLRLHADSPVACTGESGWDAASLCSQDTCPWEVGLSWLNKSPLLEETTRSSCQPIRDVRGADKSTCRYLSRTTPSPRKRSRSHDSLSVSSRGRTLQGRVHFLRRHHSAPTISRQMPTLQNGTGVFPPSSLTANQLRFIQEMTSGSSAFNSDITASLSGKVSQLEKILHQLRLDLLKEQRDKAALQQQVLDLRQDNLRLREESQNAAEQIRRFTTWMLRRGSLP